MEIPVDLPEFKSQRLSVETAGLWSGARLLLNGVRVEGKKGIHSVRNDAGAETAVVLKPGFPDPLPTLLVGGAAVALGRPLAWYEYAWMCAPVLLLFIGGVLGGLFGAGAMYLNARIFRSDMGAAAKYGLTGLVSSAAVVGFLALALIFRALIGA